MTDLAEKQIGEAKLNLKVEDGKMIVLVSYDGKQTDAEVKVSADLAQFIDLLTEAIPGEVDDKLGEMLKMALGVM